MGARSPKEGGNEDWQRTTGEILRILALAQAIQYLAHALYWAAMAMLLMQTMIDESLARSLAILELVAAMTVGLLAWLIATAEVAGPLLSSF